jgi:hypothetical protein
MIASLFAAALLAALDAASAYKIEALPSKAKAGAVSKARLEVVPLQGAHVSPDAPISLTVQSGAFAKVEKEKFGRPDAKSTDKQGVAFEVPFTAKAGPGQKDELHAKLVFFICTETLCERQSRDVTLALEVE